MKISNIQKSFAFFFVILVLLNACQIPKTGLAATTHLGCIQEAAFAKIEAERKALEAANERNSCAGEILLAERMDAQVSQAKAKNANKKFADEAWYAWKKVMDDPTSTFQEKMLATKRYLEAILEWDRRDDEIEATYDREIAEAQDKWEKAIAESRKQYEDELVAIGIAYDKAIKRCDELFPDPSPSETPIRN